MNKQVALEQLDRRAETLFSIGDAVWDHPETDYTEEQSSAILKQALEQEGFTVQSNLDGIPTAFSGTYGSGAPVIGILGEFDALSGLSQKAGITHPDRRRQRPRLRPQPVGDGEPLRGYRRQGIPERKPVLRHSDLLWLPCRGGGLR